MYNWYIMALKRRNQRRRALRRRTRRGAKSSKGSIRAIVKREISKAAEMKWRRSLQAEATVNTLAPTNVYELLGMTQGTGQYQRIGNEITLKGFHSKGFLHNNSVKTVFVRHMIAFAYNDDPVGTFRMFEGDAGNAVDPTALAAPYLAMFTSIYKKFFRPIYDRVYTLEGIDATTGGNKNVKFFNVFKKLNKKIKFDSTKSGVDTKPRLLEVFICATADDDDGTGYVVELSRYNTEYWHDM